VAPCSAPPSRPLALATAARPMLEDIGDPHGGKAITEDLGIKLENVKLEDLGRAKKITIARTTPRLSKAPASPRTIEGRVKQIRSQVENTTSDYDKEKLQERLASCRRRRRH